MLTRFEQYFIAALQGMIANGKINPLNYSHIDIVYCARDIALSAMMVADKQINLDTPQDNHESPQAVKT